MLHKVTIMNNIFIIAKKEWKDILRSKMFMYIVLILIVLTGFGTKFNDQPFRIMT
jgi:ABC-type transport system involved in multi-copper enzyme maturation permease subunit